MVEDAAVEEEVVGSEVVDEREVIASSRNSLHSMRMSKQKRTL